MPTGVTLAVLDECDGIAWLSGAGERERTHSDEIGEGSFVFAVLESLISEKNRGPYGECLAACTVSRLGLSLPCGVDKHAGSS